MSRKVPKLSWKSLEWLQHRIAQISYYAKSNHFAMMKNEMKTMKSPDMR